MSRIGKQPITIENGVEAKLDGNNIYIKGPKGELSRELLDLIETKIEGDQIIFTPKNEEKETNAFWGLQRSLVFNMVEGVTKGFEKRLELIGVGYKARVEGKNLVIEIGFSHPVIIEPKEGITFEVDKNIIIISGIDKELVGQTASSIRKIRKPEPYKGKGIRYEGEIVKKKLGKKAAGAA